MTLIDVFKTFGAMVPSCDHMLQMFAESSVAGREFPYTGGLCQALSIVDECAPGYAQEMIARMASVKGTGDPQFENLIQIGAEIYVTCGAVQSADVSESGAPLFRHEPRVGQGKNPEFEACAEGLWYAVEVKTASLIAHNRRRAQADWQLLARIPAGVVPVGAPMLPRDHPVKDFLISANEKFTAYAVIRADAVRVLTIVWDDHVQEPLAALLNPASGLLTENSFHKDETGAPVQFSMIDAILLVRYQHQIYSLMARPIQPLIDNERAFEYHHYHFPPKALIQNPYGRPFPPSLLHPLNATKLEDCFGAEYALNMDMVLWI